MLYVATGRKYIQAAIRSAETVRQYAPGLPIHLYADWPQHGFTFDVSASPFTTVAPIDHPHPRSKVDYLAKTPFGRTLYLDTDTALTDDVRDVFALLDRFDMAMAHAHRRDRGHERFRTTVPPAYPQFNSGVMLFRRSPKVLALFEEWSRAYKAAGVRQDQPTLREILWECDLRVATLAPEYNVRFLKYHLLWYPNEARTRILHHPRFHDGSFWWVRRSMRHAYRLTQRIVRHSPLHLARHRQ